MLNKAIIFFGYLVAMILVALVIGQKFALPLLNSLRIFCGGRIITGTWHWIMQQGVGWF
ncbi:MAG: hypothetical protein ACKVIK_00390 [Rhodospirillales bacterium]